MKAPEEYPPSITISEPDIYFASFDIKNLTIFAISEGIPNLFKGILFSIFLISLSVRFFFVKSVFIKPGDIVFTLMPIFPN